MSDDTPINESISVWVFFDPLGKGGKIFPIAISWRRRLIKFKKLIFVTSHRVGETRLVNLVCAGDSANYEIEYNASNNLWKLVKVMPSE